MSAAACAKKAICDAKAASLAEIGNRLNELDLLTDKEREEMIDLDERYIAESEMCLARVMRRLEAG